jgi:predicted DNA-binding transcriptional regulator AlpA
MQSLPTHFDKRINWRVNDFCRAHGIGRTLFYEEVKRGEIKIIKIGKRTLVPDSEAKAWQSRKSLSSQ